MSTAKIKRGVAIPAAIVIAGLLIAGTIIFISGGNSATPGNHATGNMNAQPSGEFRMPNENDHIRGSSTASITIVEYSDFNCTFCARIHPTLSKIVEDYNGEVNWVYRHFANYAQGRVAAVGSECVAALGGNDAFWDFIDTMFNNQRRLGDAFSIETAVSLGVDQSEFEACLNNSKEIEAKIVANRNEAIALGGRGTPFVVVVTPKGQLMPFSGALPYEQISAVIEQARSN
ncbi:hypothetical protein COU15_00955 [Candidatus Kaiserbacteria bacterium CG10_big_fil_rev_8_21_14_0_10_45_20]|uniref:Thioredoxin-like fold domain-containing protein n=1 Tax=Candidatus Kaiserbacteria bacterium CG10_big_fil_rev_8_21_14_0_10_45_20 TaxID=1974607 RepID=A0A2H0UG95_9BACT|nr:MAG: hypothetical protein COU15_00955 [Candidatus Kaiserbacteria bacterium CG10_big_fil_rev_8_21_14_0_10_45_20]